jgi:hypothetical protein
LLLTANVLSFLASLLLADNIPDIAKRIAETGQVAELRSLLALLESSPSKS